MQKESPRTRGFEGCYSHYFAGGFVLRRCRNSIRRYSAAPKREFRSQFPLFPLCALCFLLCSLILSGLQSPEHGNPLRYAAAQCWDSAGTKIETQAKLGRGEFQFLSQWEKGGAEGRKSFPGVASAGALCGRVFAGLFRSRPRSRILPALRRPDSP